ncbi:MAG TPA: hypothetical protein VKM72_13140 [Thermoanaerobaculia bacterium]|nr:hypothetical protein [Thermoanaerobaculia bacterium]
MRREGFLPVVAVLLVLVAGCQAREPEGQDIAQESAAAPSSTAPADAASPAAAPAGEAAAPPPPAATAAQPAAPAPATVVASQQSNWPGVVVDVTEFRRKGSTLTARVVLRNEGSAEAEPDISYNEVYVMDLGAGKKYEVLKDENGSYIAALRQGYDNRWYKKLSPGETYTLWMKFPAPPPDVKAVTLQIPGLPPYEDLPIQDA